MNAKKCKKLRREAEFITPEEKRETKYGVIEHLKTVTILNTKGEAVPQVIKKTQIAVKSGLRRVYRELKRREK